MICVIVTLFGMSALLTIGHGFILSGRRSASIPSVRFVLRRNLNRLLCEMDEVKVDENTHQMTVLLQKKDARAIHIKEVYLCAIILVFMLNTKCLSFYAYFLLCVLLHQVLHLQPGDLIRSGIVNVGMTNHATIGRVDDGVEVILGTRDNFYSGVAPCVDLILALPRPSKLEKLLPVISCLGVRRLFVVGANKVDPNYYGWSFTSMQMYL